MRWHFNVLISRVFPTKEPCLLCGDKARTHTGSKPLARGQKFNANVSVLCASSLSSLLIKSLFFFWFLFDRSKAFDLLNPLYLVRCSSLSSSITTGLPAILLKHWFCFGAHRDFARPEFILAHTAHLPPPALSKDVCWFALTTLRTTLGKLFPGPVRARWHLPSPDVFSPTV